MFIDSATNEVICTISDKPFNEYYSNCPLHFFAFSRFKQVLEKKGYEYIGYANIFYNRETRDFIYADTSKDHYTIEFYSTHSFSELEEFFTKIFLEDFKKKHVLIQGLSCRVHDSFKTTDFDEISHTFPQTVVSVLEKSLWQYEELCTKYSHYRLSNTLGILLYGPPGVGKSFVLRSYLNKLLTERNFTIVQIYHDSLYNLNMAELLESCRKLFPCILFLEDIDISFKDRREPKGTLAGELLETFEGLSQAENVVLIATSNNMDVIEKALLRPGRIDYLLEIETPSKNLKELVLSNYINNLDFNLPDTIKETLVESADTFAELNGAYQHVIRSYLSTGEFPSPEEIASLARTWKETRISGLPEIKERKVGLV